MKTEETKRREKKKAIDDIFRKGKDSIMMEEIVNEDFEKTSNGIKSPDEARDAVSNMENSIRGNYVLWTVLWLAY